MEAIRLREIQSMSNHGERLDNNRKENDFEGKTIFKTAIIKLLKYDNNSSTSMKPPKSKYLNKSKNNSLLKMFQFILRSFTVVLLKLQFKKYLKLII